MPLYFIDVILNVICNILKKSYVMLFVEISTNYCLHFGSLWIMIGVFGGDSCCIFWASLIGVIGNIAACMVEIFCGDWNELVIDIRRSVG